MRHKNETYLPTPEDAHVAYEIFRKLRGHDVRLAEHICVTILAAIASVEAIELSEYDKPGWRVTVRRIRGVDDSPTVNPALRVLGPMLEQPLL